MVQISGNYLVLHMKLVEGIARESELLDVGYLNSDDLIGRNISHFHVQVAFAYIKIPIGSFSSFIDSLFVLLLRFSLLLNNPLDHFVPKLGSKFVNACFRINRKVELNFQELVRRIQIALSERYIGDRINNLDFAVK